MLPMFVILQKYDFSSKSQPFVCFIIYFFRCLWYCKSTIFQANHNGRLRVYPLPHDVCDTAKVRFFKQITTPSAVAVFEYSMFVILQKYDFSSKSQHERQRRTAVCRCLWYCKSTIFQANHNAIVIDICLRQDVCDTAKVRFFKQITTTPLGCCGILLMFVILQKYDFSSKSQLEDAVNFLKNRCLWYCKSTIFQANHNNHDKLLDNLRDVCDTAKVRFFKQITTIHSRIV